MSASNSTLRHLCSERKKNEAVVQNKTSTQILILAFLVKSQNLKIIEMFINRYIDKQHGVYLYDYYSAIKEMNYCYVQEHGWILKKKSMLSEISQQKRIQTVWL